MEFKNSKVAIIGAGPAGCMCAYFAKENCEVTLFDFASPLHTLLYTGGGRCNLAYAEYYFKDLAKFYPRGEKFLYSVFSAFSTADTTEFFEKIGVETYIQDDLRIFPTTNSAKDVREKFLDAIRPCKIKREKVLKVIKRSDEFLLTTDCDSYHFDIVVIAVGGHAGFSLAKNFDHEIIEPKPALVGLVTKKILKPIQGVSLKNVSAEVFFENSPNNVMLNSIQHRKGERLCDPELNSGRRVTQLQDDILFTHEGISGPLAYKISSICARLRYNGQNPLKIKLDFIQQELDLQGLLNSNPKKDIKNLVSEFVPKSLANYLLTSNGIDLEAKCCNINAKMRDLILKSLTEFEIEVISPT